MGSAMQGENLRSPVTGDLLIVAVGVCGVALLYWLQFLAGYLGSIGLWFCGAVLYYCLCPALLVTLLFTRKEHGIRIVAVFILLMASVCTFFAPPYLPFTRGFLNRMKSEIDPHELQTWAVDLIKTRRAEFDAIARSGVQHIEPKRDKPPEFVRKIHGYGNPHVGVGTRDEQWEASLIYGGRVKGWGLFVGDIYFRLQSDDTLYVVQWEPGVFVVHTR
jgi:hypothetical protein